MKRDAVSEHYAMRLQTVQKALKDNRFDAHLAPTADKARELVLTKLLPEAKPQSLSFGGSTTFMQLKLYEPTLEYAKKHGVVVFDPYDNALSEPDKFEARRKGLLTDVYLMGTNALIETGELVNLDMWGNRVGALCFGPKRVIVLIGRNKLVADLNAAMVRIKEVAAPVNARRLGKKTPCAKTAYCADCDSPERICCTWTVTEKCCPAGRISVVLINEDLGF